VDYSALNVVFLPVCYGVLLGLAGGSVIGQVIEWLGGSMAGGRTELRAGFVSPVRSPPNGIRYLRLYPADGGYRR
jgi:hypothetical protein